jgi:hypothetical protein
MSQQLDTLMVKDQIDGLSTMGVFGGGDILPSHNSFQS